MGLLASTMCPIFSGQGDGSERRLQQSLENDATDEKYGFMRYKKPQEIVGWLLNMHPVSVHRRKAVANLR